MSPRRETIRDVVLALTLVADGHSIRDAARMAGTSKSTITRTAPKATIQRARAEGLTSYHYWQDLGAGLPTLADVGIRTSQVAGAIPLRTFLCRRCHRRQNVNQRAWPKAETCRGCVRSERRLERNPERGCCSDRRVPAGHLRCRPTGGRWRDRLHSHCGILVGPRHLVKPEDLAPDGRCPGCRAFAARDRRVRRDVA